MQPHNRDGFIDLLLARLERIQADSRWAHRASGVRGSLIEALEKAAAETTVDYRSLDRLTDAAFEILVDAAREKS